MDGIKERIDRILTKPVDRREFLKLSGIVVLSVIGVGRILQVLNFHSSKPSTTDGGWGHTAYGGPKNHTVS